LELLEVFWYLSWWVVANHASHGALDTTLLVVFPQLGVGLDLLPRPQESPGDDRCKGNERPDHQARPQEIGDRL